MKINRHVSPFLLLFAFLLISIQGRSQDLHFSQFFHAPLNLNPALTGVFEGDLRFGGNYRNQWASVPVPYNTVSLAHDQKFYHKLLKSGFIGWGLVFNYDKAGDSKLNWTQLGANIAYTQQLEDEHFLTAGFQLKTGQRALEPNSLYFDDQYNGDIFDPGSSTAESFNATNKGYVDLSAGLNYFYLPEDSRSRLYIGGAAQHLNQPKVGFLDDQSTTLPMLFNIYGIGWAEIHNDFDLRLQSIYQFQGPYSELIVGGGVRYHLEHEKSNKLAVLGGVSYRLQDAVIAHFEVYYLNWRAGLSYDINTSPFNVATNNNGGLELSLQYIITRVKPPDTFKSCPIF